MYMQTQRLLGQQSLAEFMGLHLNLEKVWEVNNAKREGKYVRKAGLLINMGDNPTKS